MNCFPSVAVFVILVPNTDRDRYSTEPDVWLITIKGFMWRILLVTLPLQPLYYFDRYAFLWIQNMVLN